MRNILRDFRHAARLLAKSPAFTTAAVLTLALGIGANTAMFTLAEATLLRPVQVHNPHELVVWSWTSSYPDYREYMKRTDVFQGVAAVSGASRMNIAIDGEAQLAQGVFVSGSTFDVLGVHAAAGRLIGPTDDMPGRELTAVLGHDYWRSRFGGDPGVVGRSIRINERPVTIVGIAERGFRGTALGSNPALYLPTAASQQISTGFFSRVDPLVTRGFVWLILIGRLQPDTSIEQANAVIDTVYAQLSGPPEPGRARERMELEPLPSRALGSGADNVRTFVALLVGVVALTLLIGCANLANLLLAKSAVRRREIGVRLALGATRARVVQQLLVESVLLAAIGGAAGVGVATIALQLLSKYQLPGGILIANMRLAIDGSALAATFGLSLLTGIVFGALPAWRASRADVLASLGAGSRSATSRSTARNVLLGAQVALSLVLLVGTGLFTRSLASALETSPGFDSRGVLTASVNLGLARYEAGTAQNFYAAALERVRALPQVERVAWGNLVPTRGVMTMQTDIEGYTKAAGESITLYGCHVGPEYFATVRTRILSGREFSATDAASAPPVAVISDAMAKKYFAGRNPIGGRFQMFNRWVTVVGVAENTVVRELKEEPLPQFYLAFDQWLSGRAGIALDSAHLFVRTSAPAETVLPILREQLRSLDPELPLYDMAAFEDRVARLVMPQRMGVALLALFSALALALATVGTYGVASYVASLRSREIGVRIALGASSASVRRLILRQGATPIAIGIAAGLALALYVSRFAEAFLYDVKRFDIPTFVSVPLLLAVVALLATYVPARRASRIAPVDALRNE